MTTVADVIVRRLRDAGVRALFGMPGGGSNLDLVDAAGRAGLPFVLTATENAGAIAAIAQAEISGSPGACLTTLGPGVSSVVNGVACAFLDRAPLLVFTDRHPASAASFEHQKLDHRALLAPVTKWSATVTADNVDDVAVEAIQRATTGQPGPVHIDVPSDIAAAESPCKAAWRPPSGGPEVRLTAFAEATAVKKPDTTGLDGGLATRPRRPLLLVGLGARTPADAAAIRAFCREHRVPAMVTYKAKGVVPDDDPWFAGVFTNGAFEQPILSQADLFIAVGLDPVELLPRPWRHAQPLISIGRWRITEGQLAVAQEFVGEIADGLQELGRLLGRAEWDVARLREEVSVQRQRVRSTATALTPDRVVETAASAARGVRVTVDAGAHMFPATMLWPVSEPHEMLISNGLSTMGFALPAAIGAALLDRSQPVVALTGDGGLLMCAGELLTAARERLRIVTIVFNDKSLSLIAIKQQQRQLASAGVELGEVAWCALAVSMGIRGHVAETERELACAMAEALEQNGPSLIEARVDPRGYGDMLGAIRG